MKILDGKTVKILEFFVSFTATGDSRVPLDGLVKNGLVDDYSDIQDLIDMGFIKILPDGTSFINGKPKASHYGIKAEGRAVLESYYISQKQAEKDDAFQSLQVEEIKEAIKYYKSDLKLGEEANKLAQKANQKSSRSNKIAIIGAIISTVLAIISLIVAIKC